MNRNRKNLYFQDNVEHILFFSKSKKFFFNKDPIREKHIWKDIEWGKRKKNYNPLGKDPGNLWMRTEDDGKGKITKHLPLNDEDAIDCVLQMNKIKFSYNINITKNFNRIIYEKKLKFFLSHVNMSDMISYNFSAILEFKRL